LKILIVSWYFPPCNTIGALRVGKFVRFLIERGHDVGVVSGSRWGHPETLPLGVPLERVVYTDWADVNAPPNRFQRLLSSLRHRPSSATPPPKPQGSSDSGAVVGNPSSASRGALRRVAEFYTNLTNIPDSSVGWLPWAIRGGRKISTSWRPDLIFGSAPPFTALLACRRLSLSLGVPWVAELRDRWADDPYSDPPHWRAALDQWLERRTLRTAAGLVTVTEPWAEFYRQKYDMPVATIYNGYDPLDFEFQNTLPHQPSNPHLVIGYAGRIYPGVRDPTPLFAALRLLGTDGERFRVVFCGTDPNHVHPLAQRAGVSHLVEVRAGVPYQRSLEFQQHCDVLLLMQWNDPREQGNCPGKFFEYIASLRPQLVLGLENGVPATIVRERSAGFCANDPAAIATQLRQWLAEKDQFGSVRALPRSAREGLSRNIQYEKLESFLRDLVPHA
jgi:glycosyltransferase involved in cell wall biosynthesis